MMIKMQCEHKKASLGVVRRGHGAGRWSIALALLALAGLLAPRSLAAPNHLPKPQGELSPRSTPCPTPDPYEDDGGGTRDDSFATASAITPLAGQPGHTFDRWSDKDWAQFEAQAGGRYTIVTSNLTPPYDPGGFFADTVLELYASDGVTLLDSNDDYGGTYASGLDWQAPQAGTYYLKVYNYNPGVFGCEVGYDLTLTEIAPLAIQKIAADLDGAPLYVGDIIRYTITVTNTNLAQVHTAVVISDTIPTGATFVAGSVALNAPPGNWSLVSTSPELRVQGDSLPALGVVTVTFEVQVDAGTVGQSILNQAHVNSDQMDRRSTPWVGPPGGAQVVPLPSSAIYIPIVCYRP